MPAKKKSRSSKPKTEASEDKVVAKEILEAVQQLRARCDVMVLELGRMEVRKSAVITEINALNQKATALLRQEGDRLGIAAGVPWRISLDGKAMIEEQNAS